MLTKDGLGTRSEQPVLPEAIKKRRKQLRLQDQDSFSLERVALDSRVIIIEGISGSGKDTFQTYLKRMLKDRDLYEYSEGHALLSWNQLQIKGIFKLQVKLMKLFVCYIREIVSREQNAVFILNRFHLSAYVLAIAKQPKLEREYDAVVSILRTLPVHIVILQLDENEIEKRSLHPERSSTWQKFQQQIVEKEGFRDSVERYVWQQRLMLETAEKQQIPYSMVKFPFASEISGGRIRVPEAQNNLRHNARMNAKNAPPKARSPANLR
jgi:thymidylate kinase